MLSFGSITFLNPWLLAGILALPVLWWLLRAIPPSPRTQIFPGVRLLLGLEDEERQSDKTPWWLLLLRCLAIAAALIGLAQPVSNLTERLSGRDGTLLVLMDQGWASAPEWADRKAAARGVLEEADQAGRDVLLWLAAETSADQLPPVTSAKEAMRILETAVAKPWAPNHQAIVDALATDTRQIAETVWLHDGLSRDATDALLAALADLGPVRTISSETPARAVTPPRLEDGALKVDVLDAGPGGTLGVLAMARAEDGGERRIAVATVEVPAGGSATATFDLPPALQGSVTRVALTDRPSAGGAAFADGAINRISVGIAAAEGEAAVTTLVSPTHYVEKALVPWADARRDTLAGLLSDAPAAIVLPDYGNMADDQRDAVIAYVEEGGLLIRFAGPRLAASIGAQGFGSAQLDDPLLPVRLRRGGRVLGGALAWSAPRALGPFGPNSPFRGLAAPEEVDVRTQVLAEPSPDLAGKIWASLDDGTPLVTAKRLGEGQVVLFHVSADAEWSSLPLSGLFVEMLGRLTALAQGRASGLPSADDLAGSLWRAEQLMGADGSPQAVSDINDSIPGERLTQGVSAALPPGVYIRADGGGTAQQAESVVINLTTADSQLLPFPDLPSGVTSEVLGGVAPERFGALLIVLAIVLIAADVIGTLVVSGRVGSKARTAALGLAALVFLTPPVAEAQNVDPLAIPSTAETTLGYVLTGNPRVDEVSERGLAGLGQALTRRTAIEPGPPVGVTPGRDELSYFPVLYLPLSAETLPGAAALEALSSYLQGGGLLIIDTQNGPTGFGGASATQMRQVARALNLPPLAPVDDDHVLTRTFYLLSTFPGRWRDGRVWAEAAPAREGANAAEADIPQFDRVDDNVSPVLFGSADWAAAWAVDEGGLPMYPIGRPGDRQREMAIRFGVNAVMYALTGNYKSDQVHAPAVLQRLGQ